MSGQFSKSRTLLYTGIALTALSAAISGAMAAGPDVSQKSNNNATVSNPDSGTNTIKIGDDIGTGASGSTSASGAVSSTSLTGINTNFTLPNNNGSGNNFGTIKQSSVNAAGADITNNGAITGTAASVVGNAGALSIGAQGAVAAFSISGMADTNTTFSAASSGDIIQGSGFTGSLGDLSNAAKVTNTGTISSTTGKFDLSGKAASASITATGAQGSVGISYIGTGAGTYAADTLGAISQQATNNGQTAPTNSVANTSTGLTVGAIDGPAASARVSASGALTSVSILSVGSSAGSGGHTLGAVTQKAYNGAKADGTTDVAAKILNTGGTITAASLGGVGSSATINATGAAASISVASISDVAAPGTTVVGAINQTATNFAGSTITNIGNITLTGGITGAGSSAAISAVGAGGYVSFVAMK